MADLSATDGLIEQSAALTDQARLFAADLAQVLRAVGNERRTGIAPAGLLEITLGEDLAVVHAQHAVGVGNDFAVSAVVAKQRAAGKVVRYRQGKIVEYRGGQVDMAVDALLELRQFGLLRRQHQIEAPGRSQAYIAKAMGLVGGDDDQCVL